MIRRTRFSASIFGSFFSGDSPRTRAGFWRAFGGIWRGALYAPDDGGYVLTLESDDGSALYLDSRPVIDHWRMNTPARKTTTILMRRGFHRLALHYENLFYSGACAFSGPPGAPLEIVPSEYLFSR